jgi:hypothetical protein
LAVAESVKLDFDPDKVLASLKEIAKQSREMSRTIEESIGKDAAKSVKKLEDAAENGSGKIAGFFRNLGTRVKEDLKRAFDMTSVLAGAKFTDELLKGTKQVFDFERAFDRLNARLGLSRKEYASFKTELGKGVAATGASLDKVLPGVETMAAKGGMKNPKQLADVGTLLGKFSQATGEDTGGISDSIVEILQTQGKAITSQSVKETLDAAIGARNAGAFKSTSEAATAIEGISPYAKRLGIGTREAGGLAAQASQSGSAGQGILQDFLRMAADKNVDRGKLEGVFGQKLFNGGKFDASALGKIDMNRMKGISPEKFAEIGFGGGASGGDFVRFVEAFKGGQERFKQVIGGADETNKAFSVATDNLASRFDKFKGTLQNAGREVGGGLSTAAEGLISGDMSKAKAGAAQAGTGLTQNAGTIAAGVAGTLAVGLLTGGGLRGLLSSAGGNAGGLVKGQAAKAAGITPVYVTNAAEIGGGGAAPIDQIGKFAGLGKYAGALGVAGTVGAGAAALGVGAYAGNKLDEIKPVHDVGARVWKALGTTGESDAEKFAADQEKFRQGKISKETGIKEEVVAGIIEGMKQSQINVIDKGPLTNPSDITNRGGSR